MKSFFAPRGLCAHDLRALLDQLHATPLDAAKFLDVTERSIWRWLSDGTAPRAALLALWHETPAAREAQENHAAAGVGYDRGLSGALKINLAKEGARLARLVAIADTGAANDALLVGPWSRLPVGHVPCFASRNDALVTAGDWHVQHSCKVEIL